MTGLPRERSFPRFEPPGGAEFRCAEIRRPRPKRVLAEDETLSRRFFDLHEVAEAEAAALDGPEVQAAFDEGLLDREAVNCLVPRVLGDRVGVEP